MRTREHPTRGSGGVSQVREQLNTEHSACEHDHEPRFWSNKNLKPVTKFLFYFFYRNLFESVEEVTTRVLEKLSKWLLKKYFYVLNCTHCFHERMLHILGFGFYVWRMANFAGDMLQSR